MYLEDRSSRLTGVSLSFIGLEEIPYDKALKVALRS